MNGLDLPLGVAVGLLVGVFLTYLDQQGGPSFARAATDGARAGTWRGQECSR